MTAARPLGVVVIGAGYFAGFHIDAWARMAEVALLGIADLAPETARAQALRVGLPDLALSGEAATLLAETKPAIVDIAAPPTAHADLIASALAARPRAIVCQKPFCGSLEEATRMTAEAEAAGIPLIVHENVRFQPWYRAMKQALDRGLLGELYQASFRLRPGDGQGPAAYLDRQPYFQAMQRFLVHETAIHWVDTFRFLLGEPQSVFADLRRLNPAIAGEDAGFILFRYSDGRRALFDGNRLADHAAANRRLTMGEALLEGSAASLSLNGEGDLSLRAFGDLSSRPVGGDYPKTGFGGECVQALQQHVVDHLTRGTTLENEARAYLRNLAIEAAIYRSSESGAAVTLEGP
ncbi:MAG: Gfo/Idh/MocA family oxidoreductase [Rhodospirillales bacterium]